MDHTELIESYFSGTLSGGEKQLFEQRIQNDPSFADEVAFYVSAHSILQQRVNEEKKHKFREIYNQQKTVAVKTPVIKIWRYVAAAGVIIVLLVAAWLIRGSGNTPKQLADNYIQQKWESLDVTMSGIQDSLQQGVKLYNAGKLKEALPIFETLALTHAENTDAQKYSGIVYLRLGNYDKALQYFSKIEATPGLYSNPGKFCKAITLLERNNNDDLTRAKQLLHEVVNNNLEGKNEAEEILKKL